MPSSRAYWALMCTNCMGEGYVNGGICEECNGEKDIPQDRCPNSTLTDTVDELFEAWRDLQKYNTWPVLGSKFKQPAQFLQACTVLDRVQVFVQKRREEHQKRKTGNNG